MNFSDDELLLLPFYTHLALVGPSASARDPEVVCGLARAWEQGVAAERSALWAAVHAAAAHTVLGAGAGAGAGAAAARAWVACGGVTALGFASGSGALAMVGDGHRAFPAPPAGADGVAPLASDAAVARAGLRQWPLDAVAWAASNADRADVALLRRPSRFGKAQGGQLGGGAGLSVIPARERDFHRWNGDPWDLGVAGALDPGQSQGGTSEEDPGPFLLAYWMARFHRLLE